MTFLLDTHALLWWLDDSSKLGPGARDAIAAPQNTILVSVVSLWEIVIKTRIGKLRGVDAVSAEAGLVEAGFARLAISPRHLAVLGTLPAFHNDPFDHLLIAQAIAEDATLVTADAAISSYPLRLLSAST